MSGRHKHEQYRLTCLQVINWGVFDGYHRIPFSPAGTLITGASGSGKSSLLDAISLGFLSHHRRNFNASGDATAAGSSAGRRTVDKYVRGAWAEIQDGTVKRQMFLRGSGRAWSAVALTYTSTSGSAITGLVVRWFPTATSTKTESRYYLKEGDHSVGQLCNHWAERDFDNKVFAQDGWRGGDSETLYLSRLYAHTGITNSDAAQQLLGKAKSLKSVGSLDQFVRDFMLDEPKSLAQAREALKQIDPLVDARNILKAAQDQRRILGDIEALHQQYQSESGRIGVLDSVDAATIGTYVERVCAALAVPELAHLDAEIASCQSSEAELVAERDRLLSHRDQLVAQLTAGDRDIQPLRAQRDIADHRLAQINEQHRVYAAAVSNAGYSLPATAEEFVSLRAELLDGRLGELADQLDVFKADYHNAIRAHGQAEARHRELLADLRDTERYRSALPRTAIAVREQIAEAVGAATSELPYAAELFDLKPDEGRWRVAVEKVLHSAGMTLLVPERLYRQVLQHLNATNTGSLVRLRMARPGRAPADVPRGSLADKLTLCDSTHECAGEASDLITYFGDHVCVDTAQDLERHQRAVTETGLIKTSAHSARKDDRYPNRASAYIFVGNVDVKIDALHQECEAAQYATATAQQAIADAEHRFNTHQQLIRTHAVICGFGEYDAIDTASALAELARIDADLALVQARDTDSKGLHTRADELQTAAHTLSDQLGAIRGRIGELHERHARLRELVDQSARTAELDTSTIELLDEYSAAAAVSVDPLDPAPLRTALDRRVAREREHLCASRNQARAALMAIVTNFDAQFREAIPNNSSVFDEKIVDYVALCRSIEQRALPEAHDRMLKLITTQVPDAIGHLRFLADNEQSAITRQVDKVNKGLGAVEFNRGTRLTLHAERKRVEAVEEFHRYVTAIYDRAPEVAAGNPEAILAQYTDILELRQKLGSTQPEDRDWARDALDVRKRFVFYCVEQNNDGEILRTHSNSGASSGGEQEKLMAFCLAGALSFNLAKASSDDLRPVFAQLMLDEAFSKSDPQFAQQALAAFQQFGFQLVIVSTLQNANTIEPYVDNVIMVSKGTDAASGAPKASAGVLTLTELKTAAQRPQPKTATRRRAAAS